VTADDPRLSPLHDVAFPDYGERLTIMERPYLSQLNVRAGGEEIAAAQDALGVSLPTTPNTVAHAGLATALWLGPNEWLVVGAPRPAMVPAGVGLVDVSAQRTTIVLSGPSTMDILAFGCALDFERLGPEWCAQTELARAGVILWGSEAAVRVLVRASFARHLAAWLLDAASSAGLEPTP
jgi:sarcosine oxidase, subunit gamma